MYVCKFLFNWLSFPLDFILLMHRLIPDVRDISPVMAYGVSLTEWIFVDKAVWICCRNCFCFAAKWLAVSGSCIQRSFVGV